MNPTAFKKKWLQDETETILENIPHIKTLLHTKKINQNEKISVMQDLNIDLHEFLLSIGEHVEG